MFRFANSCFREFLNLAHAIKTVDFHIMAISDHIGILTMDDRKAGTEISQATTGKIGVSEEMRRKMWGERARTEKATRKICSQRVWQKEL